MLTVNRPLFRRLGFALLAPLAIAVLCSSGMVELNERREEARSEVWEEVMPLVDELEAKLRSTPREKWTDEDIRDYLAWAMMLVGWGKGAANWANDADHHRTSADLTAMVGLGYLPYWPANPFNNWEPMRVLTPEDPFSPGDLVFQECPPEAYSYSNWRTGETYAASFALSVYGPTPEFAKFGLNTTKFGMSGKEWVIAPEGALYTSGHFRESADSMDAKYNWPKRRR